MGRKMLVPGVGLEPTTLGTPVRCSTIWASRATGHGPCPIRTSLHFLFSVRKSLYDVIEIEEYFIVPCDFIRRRLVSLASCIFMNEILLVKLSTVCTCMECNGINTVGADDVLNWTLRRKVSFKNNICLILKSLFWFHCNLLKTQSIYVRVRANKCKQHIFISWKKCTSKEISYSHLKVKFQQTWK